MERAKVFLLYNHTKILCQSAGQLTRGSSIAEARGWMMGASVGCKMSPELNVKYVFCKWIIENVLYSLAILMTWKHTCKGRGNPGVNGGQILKCPQTYLTIQSHAHVYQVSAC